MGACRRCRSAQVSYGTAGPGRTGKNKREVLMEKFFGLKKHGTTVRTEILAGLTTFMAMAYILMVNANMFANPFSDGTNVLGVSYGAIYIATAISAVIGSVLIGLLSNLPLAQASGMGLNAFFVYTVCVGFGFTYANALVFVLVDGLIFILLTITGLRKKIFTAIPDAVRKAIPAGIGLFTAFLACRMSGCVAKDASHGSYPRLLQPVQQCQCQLGDRHAHDRYRSGPCAHRRPVQEGRARRGPVGHPRRAQPCIMCSA